MRRFQRFSPNLLNFQWPLSAEVEIKLFLWISHDHMINESRDSVVRYPHPKLQRLYSKSNQNSITKNINMYYKLRQACVINWGSFVLLQIRENAVTSWGSLIITNWGKCCYKLGQLLQIRAAVITK